MENTQPIQLGIRPNRQQFALLVVITAFIGGMVGMERSLIPKLAENVFHLESKTAMFSFIVAFGISKAVTNYFTGQLANSYGRKKLLVFGWLLALPIPWIIMYAPSWNWIIAANILLGMNQGLAWSSTLVMKIDLAEEMKKGLAIGINEFSGYFAVGAVTFLVAYIAANYGLRPYPFYTGVVFSILGLLLSIFFVRDTREHMITAAQAAPAHRGPVRNNFWHTAVYHKNLSAVTQAGLVNNMNDGMMWGLYPLLLSAKGMSLTDIGIITAIYPACWGIGQLFTGRLGDRVPKKGLLFAGMMVQALTLLALAVADNFNLFVVLSILLGIGKAIVYPNFLAAINENSHPVQRAGSIGIFRFLRDSGYAIGAILTGVLADTFNITVALTIVGCITLLSAIVVQGRMISLKTPALAV